MKSNRTALLFLIVRKIYSLYCEELDKLSERVNFMKHVKTFIEKFFRWLERSNKLINSIARGMIYGNIVNSNGGGVYIGKALLGEQS